MRGSFPKERAALDASPVPGRLRELARIFGDAGVRLALETGQEHAHDLAALLARLEGTGIGVNFDPANLRPLRDGQSRSGVAP
jgi:sugar phosphate isomerase/epimerase